jgi:hypothetical protein
LPKNTSIEEFLDQRSAQLYFSQKALTGHGPKAEQLCWVELLYTQAELFREMQLLLQFSLQFPLQFPVQFFFIPQELLSPAREEKKPE